MLKGYWTTFSTFGLTQEMIKALTSRAHFLQSLHCHKLVICMYGCESSHFLLFPFYFPIYAKLQTSNNSRATPPPPTIQFSLSTKKWKRESSKKMKPFLKSERLSHTHSKKIKIKSPRQKKQRAKLSSFLSNNSLFLKPCIIIK